MHPVLDSIREQKIRVRLSVKKFNSLTSEYEGLTVYASDTLPESSVGNRPVDRHFRISNLVWTIEMEPSEGWEAVWVRYMYGVVCVVSLFISIAITGVLVASYRHEKLLRSMLPRKVIKHLEGGNKTKFAEQYESVTIFFSGNLATCSNIFRLLEYSAHLYLFCLKILLLCEDIVNFTVISSELKPIEVVEMLDGMYKLFDDIAHRHGVYKVCSVSLACICHHE